MKNKKQLLILAERLRKLRKEKGESQEYISKKLGLAHCTYGTYENARYLPDAKTIKELSQHYNVTSDYLLGLSDTPNMLNTANNQKYIQILQTVDPDILDAFIDITKQGYDLNELKTGIESCISYIRLTKLQDEFKANIMK